MLVLALTFLMASPADTLLTPDVFAAGSVSTEAYETSPSFSADGQTMVFARYGDDWAQKTPYIAAWDGETWRVAEIPVGPVYNLAIAPDASSIVYATPSTDGEQALFRMPRKGEGWGTPENLTARHGIVGTYPCMTQAGDLLLYNSAGPSGAGLYRTRETADGFAPLTPLLIPPQGTAFDACSATSERIIYTHCFDDMCAPDAQNGVWLLGIDDAMQTPQKIGGLPYVWGVQVVPAWDLVVFTDGNDILSVPLNSVPELR
ncbi:MAG: hypothetical protein AAGJ10_19105 [Bacteroidota bacterium]